MVICDYILQFEMHFQRRKEEEIISVYCKEMVSIGRSIPMTCEDNTSPQEMCLISYIR